MEGIAPAPLRRRIVLGGAAASLVAPVLAARAPGLTGVVLGRDAPPGIDPAGWLVSEKFDGVRALWDGAALRFRSGRRVAAPAWFLASLPPRALDGELWLGRGHFEALVAIVRDEAPDDAAWRAVRYLVFELPGAAGSFEARAAAIARLASAAREAPWQAVEQRRVAGREALRRELNAVVAAGGEGLMLHRADAPFVAGRSDALLKLKPLADAQALVVGHEPGRGRLAGKLGALRVRTDAGVEFRLGSGFADLDRERPPALGSAVTYRYRGLTAQGVPRFASFVRAAPSL